MDRVIEFIGNDWDRSNFKEEFTPGALAEMLRGTKGMKLMTTMDGKPAVALGGGWAREIAFLDDCGILELRMASSQDRDQIVVKPRAPGDPVRAMRCPDVLVRLTGRWEVT